MKLFFAGTEYNKFADVVKDNGGTSMLQSAFYLSYKREPNWAKAPYYLLDSGGFTARKQGTVIPVEKYAEYLNKFNVKLAFNLDTMDTAETLRNQKYLEKNTKTYIIPVYHFTEFASAKYRDLLSSYAKDYPYISLGGTAEGATGNTKNKFIYFDYCFSKVGTSSKVHGLAVTGYKLMLRYPWFSVDSTSWISPLQFGKVIDFANGEFINFQSIKSSKTFLNAKQLLSDKDRFSLSVQAYVKAERYITSYWKHRGVVWDEKPFY